MPTRDPLSYKDTARWAAWTPCVPEWTSSGTDPALNNGTLSASYRRIGTVGFYRGRILMGSGTTYGTGGWAVDLPDGWAASSALGNDVYQMGHLMLNDTGTAVYGGTVYVNTLGTQLEMVYGSTWAAVGATAPFTWTTGDFLCWSITIELDYE